MYGFPYFKEEDKEIVLSFIKQNPFAFITGCDKDNKPVATQIPLFIDEKDGKLFLSGHIQRKTDHHKAFEHNPNVLAVFTGPHTYISASWYTDPKVASTWNYISVHAKGQMKFLGEQALLDVLKRTTNHFENNPESAANFEQLSKEYVTQMARAIVAFEIEVTSFDNVFKLSQNRDKESYNKIIEKLEVQDSDGKKIAEEMKSRSAKLFGE
jgi:transcriptional regulator